MKVLVACESSEIVKEAFLKRGHDAHSCDLKPGEKGLPNHHQCDVRALLDKGWDMAICFPPCTHLSVSGARWFKDKRQEQEEALHFILELLEAPINKIALENPIGVISTRIRKPDQIIQPWQFGHGETKATCLWLKGLPKLVPTNIVDGREARIHRMPPSPTRGVDRSRTFRGIAEAMSAQWSEE